MRKRIGTFVLALALMATIAVPALAAEPTGETPGIYDLQAADGYTVTMYDSSAQFDSNGNLTSGTAIEVKDGFYANAEQMTVTSSNGVDGFNLILANNVSPTEQLNEDSLVYIDQITVTDQNLKFRLYPSQLTDGTTYYICLSNTSSTALTVIASFKYYQPYKLGDVDGENGLNSFDASLILQYLVGTYQFVGNGALAADVDRENGINSFDASLILQHLVGTYTIPGWED